MPLKSMQGNDFCVWLVRTTITRFMRGYLQKEISGLYTLCAKD